MSFFKDLKKIFKDNKKNVVKYENALSKTRENFTDRLSKLNIKHKLITDEYLLDLEELLISADIGVKTVFTFLDKLKVRIKDENIKETEELKEIIVDELFIMYVGTDIITDKINISKTPPTVILVVGVNGVGKTTSIGKLAYKYKSEGKSVLLISGDTFRAGAKEQLKSWSEKVGVSFFGSDDSDPSSVIFDGLKFAKEKNIDIVLIDTAGRLENKVNLMNELEKINKVIKNFVIDAPHETLLVIDANTGQNGILQAESFKSITNITGIVLTKLDGTAKGGIVLGIKNEVGLPVKFVGLGEKESDLEAFDIESYIYGLFKDMV